MSKLRLGIPVLLAAVFAPAAATAQQAASDNHGYFGVGLVLETNTLSSDSAGDITSRGGGFLLNGAGVFDPGEGIGFGVNGGFGFTSRTLDDADVDVAEGLFDVNGGIIVADLLYVSLGLQFLNQTEDVFDSTTTYVTVPLGIGVLKGSDTGYLLAQLRFGGGSAENDQASGSEDIGYFGLRVMGQTGTADGLQFMGGLEFDAYGADDADNTTDNFFRFFFGLGFGG